MTAWHTGGMTTSYVERELKFDVDPAFVLPDLQSMLPAGGRTEIASEHLRSDYYDTAEHALLRAQITLRHRTGINDAGWQLKVPHEPFREEIRVDSHSESIPDELSLLLMGITGGRELRQIASVITDRTVFRLLAADGRTLAEIDDDMVNAASGGPAAVLSQWREVEVELGDDEDELLYALGKQLRRAGARPSAAASKLARALPPLEPAPRGQRKRSKVRLTAGDAVGAYIAEQHRVILSGDIALRRGDGGVIHKTRVATRRLRSTLRVFADLYDADRAVWLDRELAWYAALLGEVRDRQVLQKRLDVMLDEVDESLLLGPVRARVDSELRQEQDEHWQLLQHDLKQDRYLTLLSEVEAWVHAPPVTSAASRPAKTIARHVRRANRQVARKLGKANSTGDIHLLHSARKAAKRARYAAEAAEPVTGAQAAHKQADRYQRLQDLLGEHQDSLVSADLIRRLGAKAGTTPGENGFAFGILHEREEQKAQRARRKAHKVAKVYA